MLPTLVKIGPVNIYSYGVFLFVALFWGLFVWWRVGRDENIDETKLFDTGFLSILTYFVLGRVVYAASSYSSDMTIWQALALFTYPGVVSWAGVVGVIAVLIVFSRKNNWKIWKVLDIMALVLSLVISVSSIGAFLNGSNPGIVVEKFGVRYPGFEELIFPVDLLGVFWFAGLYFIVSKVRKNFRFYEWFMMRKKSSDGGLAALVFLQGVGWYYFVRSFLDDRLREIFAGMSYMMASSIVMIVGSLIGVYLISGREIRQDLESITSIVKKGN